MFFFEAQVSFCCFFLRSFLFSKYQLAIIIIVASVDTILLEEVKFLHIIYFLFRLNWCLL